MEELHKNLALKPKLEKLIRETIEPLGLVEVCRFGIRERHKDMYEDIDKNLVHIYHGLPGNETFLAELGMEIDHEEYLSYNKTKIYCTNPYLVKQHQKDFFVKEINSIGSMISSEGFSREFCKNGVHFIEYRIEVDPFDGVNDFLFQREKSRIDYRQAPKISGELSLEVEEMTKEEVILDKALSIYRTIIPLIVGYNAIKSNQTNILEVFEFLSRRGPPYEPNEEFFLCGKGQLYFLLGFQKRNFNGQGIIRKKPSTEKECERMIEEKRSIREEGRSIIKESFEKKVARK